MLDDEAIAGPWTVTVWERGKTLKRDLEYFELIRTVSFPKPTRLSAVFAYLHDEWELVAVFELPEGDQSSFEVWDSRQRRRFEIALV